MRFFNYFYELIKKNEKSGQINYPFPINEDFMLNEDELSNYGNKLVQDSPFVLSWPIRLGPYISLACAAVSASLIHAFYRKRFRMQHKVVLISYFAVGHTALYANLSNRILVTEKLKSFTPLCVPCTMIKLGSIQLFCSVILPVCISTFANIHYSELLSTFAMPPGLFRNKLSTIEGFKIWLKLTRSHNGPMIILILSIINILLAVALVKVQVNSHKAILVDSDENFGYKM